jgi:hypothetical protein
MTTVIAPDRLQNIRKSNGVYQNWSQSFQPDRYSWWFWYHVPQVVKKFNRRFMTTWGRSSLHN